MTTSNSHDYKQRVAAYLRIMQAVITIANEHNSSLLIALQPALFERQPLSTVERQLLWASLAPHESQQVLVDSYSAMRTGLAHMEDKQRVFFVDCSKLFEGERPTTFTDMWHFSDFGHEKLAEKLAPQIGRALDLRGPQDEGTCGTNAVFTVCTGGLCAKETGHTTDPR